MKYELGTMAIFAPSARYLRRENDGENEMPRIAGIFAMLRFALVEFSTFATFIVYRS